MNHLSPPPATSHAASTKRELSDLIRIALPAVAAQLATMALGTVDTIMAGQLGPDALAAVATGVNLISPLMLFLLGVFLSLNPIVSQYNGAKNQAAVAASIQSGLWFALLISVPVFFLWRQLGIVLDWLQVEPSVKPTAIEYIKALSWGTPVFWLFLSLRFCNEGLFATKAVMSCAFLAVPVNAFFNWVFMYGNLGAPKLGAVGTGYATSVTWLLMFVFMLLYTLKAKRHAGLRQHFVWHKPDWPRLYEIVRLGLPMGSAFALEVLMFAMMGLMMATYNTTIISAHQIALNYASLTFMVPLGIANAITARVGFAVGSGSAAAVRRAGWVGIGFAGSIALLSTGSMLLLPNQIAGLYTDSADVITMAVSFLSLAAIFQLSDALQVTASGALRGLKETRYPMLISMLAYWVVGFPLGWLLAHYTALGPAGYWAGMIGGLSLAAILLNWRFWRRSSHWHPAFSAATATTGDKIAAATSPGQ
ncbi:MATE family efflux transporter [Permianibacter sp. IMCC34836]|uniref:MATE family efflux transporter n=1 Tax=Permianibacter fluminis TaxID=2738515 RepID=UPI0015533408|nr:MATE family efflux transporter [Permianibacter fluminis]NQD37712.1 MATE family efflux transporter [Permianibacter fluminis]